jgi:polyhydroxybutyrate depolymerase
MNSYGLPAIVAVAALALAGCGGKTNGTAPTVKPTSVSDISGGSGCGSQVSPGSQTLSITVAGHARVVIVHIPTTYSDTVKTALVLNMHGSGSTAAEQEGFTGMDATSDADGFIVAYPQALIPDGTGFDWNIPGVPLIGGRAVPAGSADDVSFLVSLVGMFEHRYCIDPSRVYATGFSGGARISSQLACDASSTFAAVAPVSGLRRPTPCPTNRAVPVISFHGTSDPVDPYDGHGQAYWTYSVPQAATYWAAQDGCSSTAQASRPVATVTLTEYVGCRDGAAVELYSISGEGHEWPGGPHLVRALTRVLGPQSTAVDASSLIWAFFAAHPMPDVS